MKIKQKYLVIGIVFIFLLIILIDGCVQQERQERDENKKQQVIDTVKGITLTPKSFRSDDFADFFKKAKQAGNFISWSGDWNELSNINNGGPKILAELSSTYNYIPIIEAQFFIQSNGELIRDLNESTKDIYKNNAVVFAEKYKPKYLAFGIEINTLYEKSPKNFDNFVSFYDEVYDAIKVVSPNTKVFTVFQLEKMKGMNGGLFGGINDKNKEQWFLLEIIPESDIIAFTTYPGLVYKNPVDIPQDYYTEIKSHTSKPIAFTEIGWHSEASPIGWESSENEQSEFISRFFDMTKDLDKEFLIWGFMYDKDVIEPFRSMGLYYSNGSKKQVWDAWLNVELNAKPYVK